MCLKCGKVARSFPKRTPEDVIKQALDEPETFGLAFARLCEVESGERTQAFFPCDVVNAHYCFLDCSTEVDIIDSDVFSQHQRKPASYISKDTQQMPLQEWEFTTERYEKSTSTAVVARGGSVPAHIPHRKGRCGMRSEVQLLERRLCGADQLRPTQGVELFNLERTKHISQRKQLFSTEDGFFRNILSWDGWGEAISKKEARLKQREADEATARQIVMEAAVHGEVRVVPEIDEVAMGGADHDQSLDIFGESAEKVATPRGHKQTARSGGKATSKGPSPSPAQAPRKLTGKQARGRSRSPSTQATPVKKHVGPEAGIGGILRPGQASGSGSEVGTIPSFKCEATTPAAPNTPGRSGAEDAEDIGGRSGKKRGSNTARDRTPAHGNRSTVLEIFAGKTGEDKRILEPAPSYCYPLLT